MHYMCRTYPMQCLFCTYDTSYTSTHPIKTQNKIYTMTVIFVAFTFNYGIQNIIMKHMSSNMNIDKSALIFINYPMG